MARQKKTPENKAIVAKLLKDANDSASIYKTYDVGYLISHRGITYMIFGMPKKKAPD
jgi:hypothetical protein